MQKYTIELKTQVKFLSYGMRSHNADELCKNAIWSYPCATVGLTGAAGGNATPCMTIVENVPITRRRRFKPLQKLRERIFAYCNQTAKSG
ncbi:MAG: hypothetical protein PGN23_06795 [Sphingomonas adhaesiva]|uniref:hypothetical protein n=1 Tax=Sphingomonas adhaesiva TaxID=28212 RepID=UPI002FF87365